MPGRNPDDEGSLPFGVRLPGGLLRKTAGESPPPEPSNGPRAAALQTPRTHIGHHQASEFLRRTRMVLGCTLSSAAAPFSPLMRPLV